MSTAGETVLRRLDDVRQRWWLFTLLSTAVVAVCASLGLLLVLMLTDAFLILSQSALRTLSLVWLVTTLGLAAFVGRRASRSHRSLEATARRVEWELPELGSDLINVVQLTADQAHENRAFCAAAVADAAERAAQVPLEDAARRVSRWGRFRHGMQTPRDLLEAVALLLVLVGAAFAGQRLIPSWGSAASRLLAPWRFIPSVGAVGPIQVTPGDAEVLIGSSPEITAEIRPAPGRRHKAVLYLRSGREAEIELPMLADAQHTRYRLTVPSLVKELDYRIQIGDSQTRFFRLKPCPKPTFSEVQITYRYPAYLRRLPETVMQKTADLEGPAGTEAELNLRPSTPIARAYLEIDGQRVLGSVENNGTLALLRMPLVRDGAFKVILETTAGHVDADARLNRVRVLPDQPPSVELLKPASESTSAPGADVLVVIRARDDSGVGLVRLEMTIQRAGAATAAKPEPRVVGEWTKFAGACNALVEHRLGLRAARLQSGDLVRLRAVALDKRNFDAWGQDQRPQQTTTAWHAIKIVSAAAQRAAAAEQLAGVRTAVSRILAQQVHAQERTAAIPPQATAAERAAAVAQIRAEQVAIHQATQAVVAQIAKRDAEDRMKLGHAASALALGPMIEAVSQCEATIPTAKLITAQERIAGSLREMLGAVRRAQSEVLADASPRATGDRPSPVPAQPNEPRKPQEADEAHETPREQDLPTDKAQSPPNKPELPAVLETALGKLIEEQEGLMAEVERQGSHVNGALGRAAVGKDAQEPSGRLTPDRHAAGQVQVRTQDSQADASDEGMASVPGGERRDRPQPSQPASSALGRLAEKQAALRNKAEGMDLQFQVAGIQSADMKKLIAQMTQVERDLAGGRYQNVLRQRAVLAATATDVKQYLRGEFHVRRDTSANLPLEIQKDILGGMGDASPAGWEQINREYFERLMSAENAPPPRP
jgi:hypothetical protein